jgi:hypothetical protein
MAFVLSPSIEKNRSMFLPSITSTTTLTLSQTTVRHDAFMLISMKRTDGLLVDGTRKPPVGRCWFIERTGSGKNTVLLKRAIFVYRHHTTMRNFSLSSPTMLSF